MDKLEQRARDLLAAETRQTRGNLAGVVITTDAALRAITQALRERPAQVEAFGWVREWDGDVSDLGNFHFTQDKGETNDGLEWTAVYTTPPPAVDVAALRDELDKAMRQAWTHGHSGRYLDVSAVLDAILAQQPGVSK